MYCESGRRGCPDSFYFRPTLWCILSAIQTRCKSFRLEAFMTAEFTVGQSVGDYEVLSILGLGGMGKVYKVPNVISDRAEAMKVLLPDLNSHQSLADRFLREIRLRASLNHPNIAPLRTALTYENQLVMIMELVDGETLANRIARAPISTAEAVNYSEQILSALSYAHKHNIIH